MFSGDVRHRLTGLIAVATIVVSVMSPGRTAVADPNQDQKFFDLLGQKEIPPVDNANSLIATAKKACARLDEGMPAGDLVELIRNNGFNENPLARLQPQDRITRTITQFINASVEAYCPYDKAKIASIAGYRVARPRIALVSLAGLPAGEINPTKPLPIPAQPPPTPEEIPPPQQQPPPAPTRRVQPAPPQAPPQQAEPPPAEAPAPDPGPPPAAPPPGGGSAGGDAPASPTPDQPSPPGHIRLAP